MEGGCTTKMSLPKRRLRIKCKDEDPPPPLKVERDDPPPLKKVKFEEAFCCICQQDICSGERTADIDSCSHVFHDWCIEKWAETENSCPQCKTRFNWISTRGPALGTKHSMVCQEVEARTQRVLQNDPAPIPVVCQICYSEDDPHLTLLCDAIVDSGVCDKAYHTYCIGLDSVPEGDWFCPPCSEARLLEERRIAQEAYLALESVETARRVEEEQRLRQEIIRPQVEGIALEKVQAKEEDCLTMEPPARHAQKEGLGLETIEICQPRGEEQLQLASEVVAVAPPGDEQQVNTGRTALAITRKKKPGNYHNIGNGRYAIRKIFNGKNEFFFSVASLKAARRWGSELNSLAERWPDDVHRVRKELKKKAGVRKKTPKNYVRKNGRYNIQKSVNGKKAFFFSVASLKAARRWGSELNNLAEKWPDDLHSVRKKLKEVAGLRNKTPKNYTRQRKDGRYKITKLFNGKVRYFFSVASLKAARRWGSELNSLAEKWPDDLHRVRKELEEMAGVRNKAAKNYARHTNGRYQIHKWINGKRESFFYVASLKAARRWGSELNSLAKKWPDDVHRVRKELKEMAGVSQ